MFSTGLLYSLPVVLYGLAERNSVRNMSGNPGRIALRYKKMEDRSFATAWEQNKKSYYMFGVFDGNAGYKVSDDLKNSFVDTFKKKSDDTVTNMLAQTFNTLEEAIQEDVAGSMAAVFLLEHSDAGNYLYTAHVGDSRIGVKIGDNDTIYTQDHTTRNQSEIERISQINPEKLVIKKDNSIELCGSSYTRVLGKKISKTESTCGGLLIATPEIKFFDLKAGEKIRVCLASDGLWERIDAENGEYRKTKQALINFFNPSRRERYIGYVWTLVGRAYSKLKRLFIKKNIELIRPEKDSQKIIGKIEVDTDNYGEYTACLYERFAGNDLLRAQAKNLVDTAYNEFLSYQKQGVPGRFDDTSVVLIQIETLQN